MKKIINKLIVVWSNLHVQHKLNDKFEIYNKEKVVSTKKSKAIRKYYYYLFKFQKDQKPSNEPKNI